MASLAPLAAACGGGGGELSPADTGGSDPAASDDATDGPTSSGSGAPNTFLTFEGQRDQLRDVLQAGLISDEFTEIGAASDADIDFEGELTVFRRAGDDVSAYTFSPVVDAEGEMLDLPALWLSWEPVE